MHNTWSLIGLTVAALAVGFGSGWALKTSPTVVQYRDQETSLDKAAEREGSETAKTATIARIESPTVRIVTRTIRVPDGTITTETERNETGGTASTATTAEAHVEYRDRERIVYQDRETVRVEAAAPPTWGVSVQAGASLTEPLISLPVVSRGVLGLTVERRLFGPINAGVWINSMGAGGVSLGARW